MIKTNFNNKHLSIQLRSDGFSFCILHKNSKEILDIQDFNFPENTNSPNLQLEYISNEFESNKLLKDGFESINVTHSNNLSTFVPKPFFNEDNLSDYLQYNIKILKNDFIAHDTLENSELVNVYIPFGYINNYLFDTFGSFEYKHTSTVLVENLLKETSNSDKAKMYIHVEENIFQIVVLKAKKMEFFNTFNYNTKEDFIYYILFATEQLNLNPEEIQLYLLNDIEQESELFKIVYKYIKNVHFFKPKYLIPKKLKLSNHSYFTLINQY